MDADQFRIPVSDGILVGERAGKGPPALVLHGGAAVPDYMGPCAAELAAFFTTIRYTQRGTPPSIAGPPYTIEQHVADAVAVLDFLGVERAWLVGHSWGGHLALHLLCAHPERVTGAVCIDPLGARPEIFREADANLRRGLAPESVARLDEIEALRRQGRVTEDDLVERFRIVWPQFFGDRTAAPESPRRVGVESSIGTNASIAEHFARGTLVEKLPAVSVPVLFVHGELDPMPVESSLQTAALIPGARVDTIPGCGHFPWWETPGEIRRLVGDFLVTLTSEPPDHRLTDPEYRSVVGAVQQWRAFASEMVQVFEEQSGRDDPACQGALRMAVLADQVLRILDKAD